MTLFEAARACGGTLAAGDGSTLITGAETDSRYAGAGTLFVPIRGEHVDGHDYIASAFEHGAAAALTARDESEQFAFVPGKPYIRVTDPQRALQNLAEY